MSPRHLRFDYNKTTLFIPLRDRGGRWHRIGLLFCTRIFRTIRLGEIGIAVLEEVRQFFLLADHSNERFARVRHAILIYNKLNDLEVRVS